jgi:hypothetical protein
MSIFLIVNLVVGTVSAGLVWFLYRREETRKFAVAIGIVALVWFLFIANGGDTITILNHSTEEICEVYFAFSPEQNGWGSNRLNSSVQYPHSRDIRLPLYFEWFGGDSESGYSGRVINCEGEEIALKTELGIDTNYEVWEVR